MQVRAHAHQRAVYSGQSLLVTNLDGFITDNANEGYFYQNTRLLACLNLLIDGRPVRVITAAPTSATEMLTYAEVPASETIPVGAVFVEVAYTLGDGLHVAFRLNNYALGESVKLALAVELAADFADSMETTKGIREQTGLIETRWDVAQREVIFRYGRADLNRAVAVRVEDTSAPITWEPPYLHATLALASHQPATLTLRIEPIFDDTRFPAPSMARQEMNTSVGQARESLRQDMPRLITTNSNVAGAWSTATADLTSLPLGHPAGPAAAIAGLPMYQQVFGRDMLTIGWESLLATPRLLRDALLVTAALQGTRDDPEHDEQPGKIIHQANSGPLATLGLTPYARYYGDYSAPQDFLGMLGQYLLWTNDVATARALLPTAKRILTWLERDGDRDGDGFLEYETASSQGIKNQGWKDSWDAIRTEDGRVVANPLATSEMQGYWHAALMQAALVFLLCGERRYAIRLFRRAGALKRRFDASFWMEDEQFYALALGPDKRQVRSLASNAGHLLVTGIVPRAKARLVVKRMMRPDFFTGWGIRTLSSDHPAYNPFSYHLGSVWPVENAVFALGFARAGCVEELHLLAEGIFASTGLFSANRLPEALGGIARDATHPYPGIYPESNEPQGWSASAIILLTQALLGIRPLAPFGLLLLDPQLPVWLPALRLEGLRVGAATLDLAVWRTRRGTTRYQVTRREGRIRVLRLPLPHGPYQSRSRRILAALASLRHAL